MGRYKPKITDLSLPALEMLVLVKDGFDIMGQDEARFIRQLDAQFPGIVKIGPPIRDRNALFSVRCPPKGQALVESYMLRKRAAQQALDEERAAQRPGNGPVDEMKGVM